MFSKEMLSSAQSKDCDRSLVMAAVVFLRCSLQEYR